MTAGHGEPAAESRVSLAPGVAVARDAVRFSFSASGGPGGQNVNKRATKAELRVRLEDVPLAEDARARLARLAGRRLIESGELVIVSEEHRSQARNRAACLERLRGLVARAIVRPRPRKPTRPSKGSVERRLAGKRIRSQRKRQRRGDEP